MNEIVSNEKEKIIIEAARKRFARFGFSKVTMDEIASDVEMGKASLYYYFPTKENIFTQVIKEEQNELANELESIVHEDISCSEKLIKYVNVRLNFFHKLVNLGTLSTHSFMDQKSIYKKLFTEFETREHSYVNAIIKEGMNTGEFKKDIANETANVLLHILQGLRFRVMKQYRDIELNEIVFEELQKEMNIAINLIVNGILKY